MFGLFRSTWMFSRYWPEVHIDAGATIEGNHTTITIGPGTIIESGAVLSTIYGGKIEIGKNCKIRRGAIISSHGGHIVIGDNCGINPYSILYGHGDLRIGDYVWFAAHCVVIPANHTYSRLDLPIYEQSLTKMGISIENDVWIGAGVKILDGVYIKGGSVIGAGSVVTNNIPAYSINVGVPARVIGTRQQ